MNFKAYRNSRPYHYIHEFAVTRQKNKVTASGRVERSGEKEEISTILDGILAEATQQEREAWEQNQRPITHTIVSYRPADGILEKDVLSMEDGKRTFQVQGVEDPGGNGRYAVYYVLERRDTDGS